MLNPPVGVLEVVEFTPEFSEWRDRLLPAFRVEEEEES
jgi:hypothetical protein